MKIPQPYVWWVKIKNVSGAPDGLELRKGGLLLGRWREPDGSVSVVALTEDNMHSFGYEKCFCDPFHPGIVGDGCPAHSFICI